ncbi:MAG: hypothetical protein ACI8TA_001586 [Cyclobacteriaceae bacterium]|jgi:hypothetical protein
MNKIESKILGYSKLILEKVSFDKRLFWKEYKKGIKKLTKSESQVFRFWMIERFGFRGRTASRILLFFKHKNKIETQ